MTLAAAARTRLRDETATALLAVQFLTRIPLPADVGWTPARMAACPRWFPAVGALIGVAAALVFWATALVWPPTLAALAATAATLLLTGAFHEDGLADLFDGVGGGADRARRLEIMRDSRVGTYGAAALVTALLAKVLALGAAPALAPLLLVAGHGASRASSVLVIATSRYVRDHGTGKPTSDGISAGGLSFALATGLAAAALVTLASPDAALGGLAGLVIGHFAIRALFERQLGGYTGDCLGAVQQGSEIGFYLGAIACL